MDAVSFLDKWNKICAYMVDVNDMSCRNCELDDICGKICSKPGEVTKEECEEFVKKVNMMYENEHGQKKKHCNTCKYLYDEYDESRCEICMTTCHEWLPKWEPKEDQND